MLLYAAGASVDIHTLCCMYALGSTQLGSERARSFRKKESGFKKGLHISMPLILGGMQL